MKVYPISLTKLDRVRCVVVGGGAVAERKVAGLLEADAQVLVISPALNEQLAQWLLAGRITHAARPYEAGDLAGAKLVFAATNRREVNAQVAIEAEQHGILLNIADDPAASSFHTNAVVRRGDVVLAASTGGVSPALSALIRRKLEATFGSEYAALSSWLDTVRHTVGATLVPEDRTRLYRALASDEVLHWLRNGEHDRLATYTDQLLTTLRRTTP